MNELNNVAKVSGTYDNIPTSLTSNTSIVNIIDGLLFIKEADMENWGSGNLTYTITLDNQTDKTYTNPIITDKIDSNLALFVPGSVTINDQAAKESEFSYDSSTHTLTIKLDDVTPSSKVSITFQVEKKA